LTYTVLIRPSAERDAVHAQDWYLANAPEQVDRFIDELAAMIDRVQQHPHAFRQLRGDARRAALRVFPYQIWYRCHDDHEVIEVLAIVHARRDLARMLGRLE